MFGGLNSQLYFASVTNDVYEFVRGLAPKPNELVLWRSLAVGSGPFYRVQHTLVKHGSVLNEANNEGQGEWRAGANVKGNKNRKYNGDADCAHLLLLFCQI